MEDCAADDPLARPSPASSPSWGRCTSSSRAATRRSCRPRSRPSEAVASAASPRSPAAPPSCTRDAPLARWWLLALLVAVFPANVHMAVNPEQIRGLDLNRSRAGRSGRGCRCSRWRCSGSGARPAIGSADRSTAGTLRAVRPAGPRKLSTPSRSELRVVDQFDRLVERDLLDRAPQRAAEQRAQRAGFFGVVDGAQQAGADRPRQLLVVDPVALGEALARLRRRQRPGQRLAADAELAGGAVEGRERELLGDLPRLFGFAPGALLAGVLGSPARRRSRRRRGRRRPGPARRRSRRRPAAAPSGSAFTGPPSARGRSGSGPAGRAGPRARTRG